MGQPVEHLIESDLDHWFDVQFVVCLVKLEALLAKYAEFYRLHGS